MRVLVTGGGHFANAKLIFETLDAIHSVTPITLIINGGVNGADAISTFWARAANVPIKVFLADCSGPIRNRIMLNEGRPDRVVAFCGGRGTSDMITLARRVPVPVTEIEG